MSNSFTIPYNYTEGTNNNTEYKNNKKKFYLTLFKKIQIFRIHIQNLCKINNIKLL
jgi:hypothetical protein